MASSEAPTANFSSLFAKKKGKKGKKGPKAYNLNLDSGIPRQQEETPKIAALNEILGGADPSEDDGWADVVEKKSVVATGGKQVAELINMSSLMTEDESTARKLEKQDIKKSFHDARVQKETAEPAVPEEEEKAKEEAPKSKGLSGDIFGGGGGLAAGGWQAKMKERELRQREQELSVENASAFPSLADAMSGPVKLKPGSGPGAPEGNPWVKRGGGSAAAAAIRAALGAQADTPPASASGAAKSSANAPPPATEAAKPPSAATKPPAAPPVWVESRAEGTAPAADGDGVEEEKGSGAAVRAGEVEKAAEGIAAVKLEEAAAEPTVVADKDALVQQFGKKKKKKKKPTEEQAGGEP